MPSSGHGRRGARRRSSRGRDSLGKVIEVASWLKRKTPLQLTALIQVFWSWAGRGISSRPLLSPRHDITFGEKYAHQTQTTSHRRPADNVMREIASASQLYSQHADPDFHQKSKNASHQSYLPAPTTEAAGLGRELEHARPVLLGHRLAKLAPSRVRTCHALHTAGGGGARRNAGTCGWVHRAAHRIHGLHRLPKVGRGGSRLASR